MLEDWPGEERGYASAHLLISREEHLGTWQLVPFDFQAYHAGKSRFKGLSNWNRWAIGIELLGDAKSGFTDFQYDECAKWCAEFIKEFGIPIDMIAGHEEISPGRKTDPGIATGNFNMIRLKTKIKELLNG